MTIKTGLCRLLATLWPRNHGHFEIAEAWTASGCVSGLLVVLYAALLIAGNVFGAGLICLLILVIGFANSRRHRMQMARHFPAHVPGKDNDLGNDWPWKDCL